MFCPAGKYTTVWYGAQRTSEKEKRRNALAAVRGGVRDTFDPPVLRAAVRRLHDRLEVGPVVRVQTPVDAEHAVGHRLLAVVIANHRRHWPIERVRHRRRAAGFMQRKPLPAERSNGTSASVAEYW